MLAAQSRIFGSKVGRRIFGMIALAGLAPLVLAVVLSQLESKRELRRIAVADLNDEAKVYGMAVIANLKDLSDSARYFADRHFAGKQSDVLDIYGSDFLAAWRLNGETAPTAIAGSPEFEPDVAGLDKRHLQHQRSQLFSMQTPSGPAWLLALRPTAAQDEIYVFQFSTVAFWQPHSYVIFETEYCVVTEDGRAVHCSSKPTPDGWEAFAGAAQAPRASIVEWVDSGGARLSARWPIFLEAEFAYPTAEVFAIASRAHAFRTTTILRHLLPPSIALVVVLVLYLSMRLIRSNLVPLSKLMDATRAYGSGNLDTRVSTDRSDEFGDLATAFNDMAEQLTLKIDTLRAMSKVDNNILSGKPIDEICRDFLAQYARITGAEVCALCTEDTDNELAARLLVYHARSYSVHRLSLAHAIRHTRVLGQSDGSPIPVNQLQKEIAGVFAERGVSRTIVLPAIYGGQACGSLIMSAPPDETITPAILEHCRNLIGRLAVGMASAEREEALYRRAHFDDLTHLPNRQLLKDRIQQCLNQVDVNKSKGALLFLDLDRFKEVNDVFGHSVGDVLLREAARRIESTCTESMTIARLGGDEFVVLVPDFESIGEVEGLADRLVQRLGDPFDIRGSEHIFGTSIGIVLFPEDGDSVEALLRNSDAAMYMAKNQGRGRYTFFSQKLNARNHRKFMLERDLRQALETDCLEVYYQPQFNLDGNTIRGAEALLRWKHPDLGYVAPDEFIPVAEESDLIIRIGKWVIEQACKDLRSLLNAGLHPGIMSINVSARQLVNNQLTEQILDSMRRNEINPGFIELEITESIVAHNKDTALNVLAILQSAGIGIAMDDFGTGYSSLSYLRHLPIDILKIDRAFVSEIGSDRGCENICRAIITMAHSLGKKVVAEGVETEKHAEFLRHNKCEYAQGYHFAKPMPAPDFLSFIQTQSAHTQRRQALEVI